MPSLVVQSAQTSSAAASAKVRSMLTRRRAGWVCEAKLGAAPVRPLEGGEVELAHLQQGLHDFCRVSGFRVAHHLPQYRGDNLPRHAEAILEPATRSVLSAFRQPCPQCIDLVLGLAGRDEREGLRERERRSAIEGRVFLSVQLEARVPPYASVGSCPAGRVLSQIDRGAPPTSRGSPSSIRPVRGTAPA